MHNGTGVYSGSVPEPRFLQDPTFYPELLEVGFCSEKNKLYSNMPVSSGIIDYYIIGVVFGACADHMHLWWFKFKLKLYKKKGFFFTPFGNQTLKSRVRLNSLSIHWHLFWPRFSLLATYTDPDSPLASHILNFKFYSQKSITVAYSFCNPVLWRPKGLSSQLVPAC